MARPPSSQIAPLVVSLPVSLLVSLLVSSLGCRGDSAGDDEVGETATETASDTTTTSTSESGESESSSSSDTSETSESSSDTSETSESTDTSETTGGPDPGNACGTLLACMNLCPDDEPSCEQTCLDASSMLAIDEYDAVVQCIVDNACQDDACIDANCGAEIYACFTGALTCGELLACADTCMGADDCQVSCFYDATALAQSQGQALQDCIEANQCMDDPCIAENCGAELQTCAGGMSDFLPCPLVADCVLQCGDDPVCVDGCQVSASPAAQAEVPPLIDCAVEQACGDLDCTEQACADEWGACFSGDLDCVDVVGCVEGCAGAELCEYVCATEASFMGQVLFGALAGCIADNMCVDEQCIADNCGLELTACGL
ncbi:hypothetical protein ACNOYE_24975 [Nannocystaceae bacterium ST9]